MTEEKLKPIHPGEVLEEEFLKPFDISPDSLARNIGVDLKDINGIIAGKRSLTADEALRLAQYFNTSAQFWLGLQTDYDLDITRAKIGDVLKREIIPIAA